MKHMKIEVDLQQVPIYPTAKNCPNWYSNFWIYSNIFNYITLKLPYNDWLNTMDITNEYISNNNWTNYYYKIFNLNWVKNWAVLYKTDNPNTNYYWIFTVCLEN
jgi:hypothetical protein